MTGILDDGGARSWLSKQDRKTRIWFVTRMALRSLPSAIGEAPFDEERVLRLLHHLLIATLGCVDPLAAKKSATFAFGALDYKGSVQQLHNDQLFFSAVHPNQGEVLYGDQQPPRHSLRAEAGENVISNAISWAVGIREPDLQIEFGGGFWELAWLVGAEQASALATADTASPGAWLPLWSHEGRPIDILDDYASLDDLFASSPNLWGFWEKWFKAIHDGEPLPWELLRMISLKLSASDWQSGAAHVAREIEKLEALFLVRQSLSNLKNELAANTKENRFGVGGNNPPEEFELPDALQGSHTIIWAAVDEISRQADAEQPDKSTLQVALDHLIGAFGKFLSWVGQKADLAVDTTIKWSIPATGGYFILNPTKFQALIEAVNIWISVMP